VHFGRRSPALACALLVLAAAAPLIGQNPRNQVGTGQEVFTSRVVTSGLANPWEVTWGPDGHLWVTERTSFRVVRVNPSDGAVHVALVLDDVHQSVVQDGLLGLALHPQMQRGAGSAYVYVAYTYDRDPGSAIARRLRVRRYTYDSARAALVTPVDVIDDLPAHDDHGGGRLVVGPDNTLYVTRGDLGANFLANYCRTIHAQDLPTAAQVSARDWTAYQGKILRMNLDGSIPADNPVLGAVRSHVYAYGFRNPQGLAFGRSALLYASEHGPSTDDEVDLVVAGKNYGWPQVAGFNDDRGYVYANWSASAPAPCATLKFDNLRPPASVPRTAESAWRHPDFIAPLATFFTVPADYDFGTHGNATIAPGGMDVYTASAIPEWASSILVTGMRTGAVYRLKLGADGKTVSGPPLQYFKANDRYRDLAISPDGRRIYLTTDSMGSTADAEGRRTDVLAHPGALMEFTYAGPSTSRGR
jgi:PQQ-dependent dehydrogenase (s-GDH family)